jgi:hypothetical protein
VRFTHVNDRVFAVPVMISRPVYSTQFSPEKGLSQATFNHDGNPEVQLGSRCPRASHLPLRMHLGTNGTGVLDGTPSLGLHNRACLPLRVWSLMNPGYPNPYCISLTPYPLLHLTLPAGAVLGHCTQSMLIFFGFVNGPFEPWVTSRVFIKLLALLQ